MRVAPTPATIKKLFGLSGNLCAYPTCGQLIIDDSGAIIGQICHIEAAEPGGERYNPNQNDDQRRAFSNLILLCGKCHIITNDVQKYTVTVLQKMKFDHEGKFSGKSYNVSDEIIHKMLQSYTQTISVQNSPGANVDAKNITYNSQVTFNFGTAEIEQELSIIDEIIKFVLKNFDESLSDNEVDGFLIDVQQKIELNFSEEAEREEVGEYFRAAYLKLSNIEPRFTALGAEQQKDISAHILASYKKLKRKNIPNIDILSQLFDEFTPNGKLKDPSYTALSRAFVLMFFEDCTIFEKVKPAGS